MKILDLTAGNRGIWFDKNHPDAMFVDRRAEVAPTLVADSRSLPDEVGRGFDLIVFDPPHVNFGATANMSRDYGHHTTAEIKSLIAGASIEAHRVARPDALMAFKWNDHDIPIATVLSLMTDYWEPLFGHKVAARTKHYSSTVWVMLKRRPSAIKSPERSD